MKFYSPLLLGLIFVSLFSATAYGDVISPLKQSQIGILSEDVICNDGLFKITSVAKQKTACVTPNTAERLSAQGWAKTFDQKTLDTFKEDLTKEIGTIKKISAIPQATKTGKLQTTTPIAGYNYIFEVCSTSIPIYAPQVVLKSDSDVKAFEMAENVKANSCILGATDIKAANPDSITPTLHNKGGISKSIAELESQVANLRVELSSERDKLKNLAPENTEEYRKTVSESTSKILQLRSQLNDVRGDLNRHFFAVYSPEVFEKDPQTKFSFLGTAIEGETINKISVTKTLSGEKYDVVFEACAGKQIVRFPIILISSDSENLSIKLGDKISPESCQLTSVKIMAVDPESITILPENNAGQSNRIAELEIKIDDLKNQIVDAKKILNELIHDPSQPADRNERATELTNKIINLRIQINDARAELYNILYFSLK